MSAAADAVLDAITQPEGCLMLALADGEGPVELCSPAGEQRALPLLGPTAFLLVQIGTRLVGAEGTTWRPAAQLARQLGVPPGVLRRAAGRLLRYNAAHVEHGTLVLHRQWMPRDRTT